MKDTTLLAARILLGLLFVVAGLGKLGDVAGFCGYMASGGVPAFLAWPVVLFEIVVGGLALIVGFQTRIMPRWHWARSVCCRACCITSIWVTRCR
jgi:putative oxidoreductase